MRYDEWAPVMAAIRGDFGYSVESDRASARELSAILSGMGADSAGAVLDLASHVRGRPAAVLGDGPDAMAAARGVPAGSVLFAADGAATSAIASGRTPDVIVTDLDGPMADIVECSRRGSFIVLHAHGDNAGAVRFWTAKMSPARLIGTTQCEPLDNVFDFGGFTDGDRAAVLAHHMGASDIALYGFDFVRPGAKTPPDRVPLKRRKLVWALCIIAMLANPAVRMGANARGRAKR